jgi:hypothetical protein
MAFIPTFPDRLRGRCERFVRLYVRKMGAKQDRRRVDVYISAGTFADLGWARGSRVIFALGTGDDAGKLQLTPSNGRTGQRLSTTPNGGLQTRAAITFPAEIHGQRPAEFLDNLPNPAFCDFTLSDGSLVIDARTISATRSGEVIRLRG